MSVLPLSFALSLLSVHAVLSAPTVADSRDFKLLNGRSSYRAFSLFDLPVVSRHPVRASFSVPERLIETKRGASTPTGDEYESADLFLVGPAAQTQFNVDPSDEPLTAPIGVVPKFTGSFLTAPASQKTDHAGQAISNPAAYFLEGADLSKVSAPKCRMVGCDGPIANDGDLFIQPETELDQSDSTCHQTFVPMNGCTNNKGYKIGMVCTICCECTTTFVQEMSKSRGVKENYRPTVE